MANAPAHVQVNRILASIPRVELERLSPDLEPRTFRHHEVLLEPDDPFEFVYFPVTGMLPRLTVLEDGEAIESSTVGAEGMAGIQVFLGATRATSRLAVQIDGRGFRMRAEAFRQHLPHCEGLRTALSRYADALFALMAQSVACNRLHPIDQRCARWLLTTHDRAEGDEFALTQEFLSQMLGVRRASVSLSAANLQAAGCIRYRHGKIMITDRKALEAAACECYGVFRRRFAQIVGN